jgi:hypothetical protein
MSSDSRDSSSQPPALATRPPHAAALPFVIHREHGVISGREITSTRDDIHGLLRLDGERLVVQWSASRETSRVGREIRTDRELGPVREVVVPLDAVAGAQLRWTWRRWPPRQVLVITAADLRAFQSLAGEPDGPGLVLEHPAELTLELRGRDRAAAREFVAELELALADHALRLAEGHVGIGRGGIERLEGPAPERLTRGRGDAETR